MISYEGIKEELKRGSIVVDNSVENLGDGFIEVTLGNVLKVYNTPSLDVTKSTPAKEIIIPESGFVLKPNELYLGRTNEWTETYGFVPILSGTEELAAIGMEIHVTAGFGDNGFEGTWTLEIVCANPTVVYPNMVVGKLQYFPLIGNADIEYRGKYFRQVDATESRLSREYEDKGKAKVMKNANK